MVDSYLDWAGIAQYQIDGDDIQRADAYRGDPTTLEFERVHLPESDKVGFKAEAGVPGGFTFLGLAEDYSVPATVWDVFVNEAGEWGTLTFSTDAEPGVLNSELHDESEVHDEL
jgi:hypothetical protein